MVLKYTKTLQKAIKSKTEAKPWMHIVVINDGKDFLYAIYVWDTREVLEEGKVSKPISGRAAIDNMTKLNGSGSITKFLNQGFK